MIRYALVAVLALAVSAPASKYEAEIEAWRAQREARLKADGGWLTVAGLSWLKEGDSRFGSDKASDIVLPASVAAHAGVLSFHEGKTRFRLEPGVKGEAGGKPVTSGLLQADSSREEDVLSLGRVTLEVIERGGRFGVRVKDMDSEHRKAFVGLRWYPVDESFRVTARFVPAPGTVKIVNVLGQVSDMQRPGRLEFSLKGQQLSIDPVLEEPEAKELFIIFRDQTAPKETYGAGRFLYTDLPKDGVVVLDFNKAYSPPCAFTAYATCPLPPKQNRLPLRIEAGEKDPRVLH